MRLFIRAMLLAAAITAGCHNGPDTYDPFSAGAGYNNPDNKAWAAKHRSY